MPEPVDLMANLEESLRPESMVRGMTSLEQVRFALRRARFTHANEYELQDGIEEMLKLHGLVYEREVRLAARDRIDFMVGTVGIEVKVAGSWRDVQRQLARYAERYEQVASLVLVTTVPMHTRIAEEINDVPIIIHRVGMGL